LRRQGDDFEPQTPGWVFLPDLIRDPRDIVVRKELNDPFAGTDLQARLTDIAAGPGLDYRMGNRFLRRLDGPVGGCQPSQRRRGTDGHTLNDRPHLDAVSVMRHHNWIWSELITKRSIKLASADELLVDLREPRGQPRSRTMSNLQIWFEPTPPASGTGAAISNSGSLADARKRSLVLRGSPAKYICVMRRSNFPTTSK